VIRRLVTVLSAMIAFSAVFTLAAAMTALAATNALAQENPPPVLTLEECARVLPVDATVPGANLTPGVDVRDNPVAGANLAPADPPPGSLNGWESRHPSALAIWLPMSGCCPSGSAMVRSSSTAKFWGPHRNLCLADCL